MADRARAFARKLWDLSRSYDFSDYQLDCQEALVNLGLARMPIGQREWQYGPEESP